MSNFRLLFLVAIFFSCNRYELTTDELKLYNVYNVGDTMVFQSISSGDLNQLYISNKVNNYENEAKVPGLIRMSRIALIEYRPLYYSQNSDWAQGATEDLLIFNNDKSGDQITLSFGGFEQLPDFNSSFGVLNKQDTINYFNKKIINYYVFQSHLTFSTGSSNEITKIIWQQKYGIVKYDLMNGDSFVRINIPDLCN